MLLACKLRIIFLLCIWLVEETETELQAEYATCSVVDSRHRNFAFLDELLKVDSELTVVWNHGHIDTCIHRKLHRLLKARSHALAGVEVHDVGPVCHDHTVPVELFLHPLCEKFSVAVERHTVVACRVHHDRKCTCLHCLLERLEMLLAKLCRRDGRRCTVLTRYRHAVSHEMLRTCSDMVRTDMVRIISLHTANLSHCHFRIHVCILTEAFPHS